MTGKGSHVGLDFNHDLVCVELSFLSFGYPVLYNNDVREPGEACPLQNTEYLYSFPIANQSIFLDRTEGGWYVPNGMMLLPPSAFFIIGLFIWLVRAFKKEQVEAPDYKIQHSHNEAA